METVIQLLITNHILWISSSAMLCTCTLACAWAQTCTLMKGGPLHWESVQINSDWINCQRLRRWRSINLAASCCSKKGTGALFNDPFPGIVDNVCFCCWKKLCELLYLAYGLTLQHTVHFLPHAQHYSAGVWSISLTHTDHIPPLSSVTM